MKAISLYQPWASLLAHRQKKIETRSWRFPFRLPAVLAVHATAKVDSKLVAQLVNDSRDGPAFRAALTQIGHQVYEWNPGEYAVGGRFPVGAVLAVGRLRWCVPSERFHPFPRHFLESIGALNQKYSLSITTWEPHFGDYRKGRFAWVFDRMELLPAPVSVRGNRKVWEWQAPADVEEIGRRFLEERLPM